MQYDISTTAKATLMSPEMNVGNGRQPFSHSSLHTLRLQLNHEVGMAKNDSLLSVCD